jgi:hypothetical protein
MISIRARTEDRLKSIHRRDQVTNASGYLLVYMHGLVLYQTRQTPAFWLTVIR